MEKLKHDPITLIDSEIHQIIDNKFLCLFSVSNSVTSLPKTVQKIHAYQIILIEASAKPLCGIPVLERVGAAALKTSLQ